MYGLSEIQKIICDKTSCNIFNLKFDPESKDYKGATYQINSKRVISRSSKITPKKTGQFVTFWKRNQKGITEPFNIESKFDFFVIDVVKDDKKGQFILPKEILQTKGIISSNEKEGKRGFRVYPMWDKPTSKQAIKTQNWQLNYFIEFNEVIDVVRLKGLYKIV